MQLEIIPSYCEVLSPRHCMQMTSELSTRAEKRHHPKCFSGIFPRSSIAAIAPLQTIHPKFAMDGMHGPKHRVGCDRRARTPILTARNNCNAGAQVYRGGGIAFDGRRLKSRQPRRSIHRQWRPTKARTKSLVTISRWLRLARLIRRSRTVFKFDGLMQLNCSDLERSRYCVMFVP
jgi:hypothetical protein